MLRRCLPRSGPTTAEDSPRSARPRRARRRRQRPRRRRPPATGAATRPRRRRAPRVEPVADAEVRVDVAPVRRDLLELLAQLAHEHVHRAVPVDHRVAPHALVDLLARDDLAAEVAQQRDQLELAAREVHAAAGGEGLELVAPDLELAGHARARRRARISARRRRRMTASARAMTSSGMARLGDPVVGAEPQPAHALGDGRLAGADHHAELREPGAELLEVAPGRRAEHRRVHDDGVEPHRDQRRPAGRARPARGTASPRPRAAW